MNFRAIGIACSAARGGSGARRQRPEQVLARQLSSLIEEALASARHDGTKAQPRQ